MGVTTVGWLAATYLTPPESPDVIAAFRERARMSGHDIGKGLLLTFVVTVAIFAFMAAVKTLICR